MFYFGRQSQGAQAPVYPYPMFDVLTQKKVDRTYKEVYLENEYLRIGILPELGGRIFEGLDKTNNYNFIYRQHVIKPALITITGAWISGGVEWNIPHHHRASTFMPVQYKVEEHADGSKTVWVGELELRQRMRWAVGYTLRPGKSYLEASLRIINRTPEVNTMLCFANVAVHTNDNYQVIFPPSTQYGTGHSQAGLPEVAALRCAGRARQDGGCQHVEEPFQLHVDLRLELRRRFLCRVRPRQTGRHHEHRGPQRGSRQEVLHLGQGSWRQHLGQGPHRRRWPVHRTHGRRLFRQPAGL